MKKLVIMTFFLFTTALIAGECFLPVKTTWIEESDSVNKLMIKIENDRNLYISYYNEKNEQGVLLTHKIYSCSEKFLYIVNEDQYVVLYAAIEPVGKSAVRFHFVDEKEDVLSVITFRRF